MAIFGDKLASFQFNIAARYIFTIMAFFGFVFNYMLRINIYITIVAMVNYSAIERANDSGRGTECGEIQYEEDMYDPADDGPFPWNEKVQSTVVSSFYWGYIVTQIIGGRLSELIGGKKIFGLSIVLSGLLNLVIPLVAMANPIPLIIVRMLLGFVQGPTFPGMHAMLARWAPPEERSWISSLVYSGYLAGTLAAYPLSGFLTNLWGWESVFYLFGSSSLIWGILWFYLVFDSPEKHPRIDQEELKYLQARIQTHSTALAIPWKALWTSLPFWAIIMGDLANNWGFTMLLAEIPVYMKHILHYDLQKSSFLSALPYLFMWVVSLAVGFGGDVCVRRKWLSIKNVRKINTTLGHFGGAVALLGLTLSGCNNTITLVLLNMAVGLSGAYLLGGMTNHIDIAPNFAGTMLGITNCLGQIPAFLAPLTAGFLTNGQQTLAQWRKIFYISAVIYVVGCVSFITCADGEVQPWNGGDDKETKRGESSGNTQSPQEDSGEETNGSAPRRRTKGKSEDKYKSAEEPPMVEIELE